MPLPYQSNTASFWYSAPEIAAAMTASGLTTPSFSRKSLTRFLEKPLTIATPGCVEVTGVDRESLRFQNTICGTASPYPASVNLRQMTFSPSPRGLPTPGRTPCR